MVDVVQVHIDVRVTTPVSADPAKGARGTGRPSASPLDENRSPHPDVDRVGDGDARARQGGRGVRGPAGGAGAAPRHSTRPQAEAQPQAERKDRRANGRR